MSGATILHASYDYRLLALSVVLAMLAAYALLDLAGRVTAARHSARALWLAGGATSIGLGVWATHYLGMLAFSLPVRVLYHYPTVILSLLAATAASVVALFTVSRERMGVAQKVVGSLVMGSGFAAAHYIGVSAMRLPATVQYRWSLVTLSVALAMAISLVALILSFQLRQENRQENKVSRCKVLSALGLGSALLLTHYAGMWAVTFRVSNLAPDATHAISISTRGALAIGIVTLAVMGGAMGTSMLDRLLTAQRAVTASAQESELYFHTLAKAVPEIIWTTDPAGSLDFFNSRWYRYTGLNPEQSRESGWKAMLHPDDLPASAAKWEYSLATGDPYEIEYRLRRADGNYRWFLSRANPVRDEKGKIIKWFGTCTDIEDQKHNQQILEDQIRDRTEELADANTKLQEEMWEKDVARRRLDEQNEDILREMSERSRRATMLAKMGELLQSCVGKEEVFAAALGFAPKIFPTSRGALALLDSRRSLAEVAGTWNDCQLRDTMFEPGSCWALRTGHPHLVVAGDKTARCAHAAGVENTYLCVPILAQGEAFGILHFQSTDEVPVLAEAELSLKTTFAGQVGLSVANIRLREALRTQSIKDPLTGLYNRRYLTEMLDREIRRAVRAEQSLGILMLDLDHFKKFNDTYGHDAGDTVLREAAAFLSKSIRIEDIVCRFGGEEFVIILPTASLNAAHARAERIRVKMRELAVLHHGQSLGMITVSVGVSALPEHGTTSKDLLEAADAALYRAKREGRDRVVNAAPPTPPEAPLTAAELGAAELQK
jgi:diguanylate cyclase (GGDEF)-like protein/PAS domain S-box-containing protein